jgi:hypothetical protein
LDNSAGLAQFALDFAGGSARQDWPGLSQKLHLSRRNFFPRIPLLNLSRNSP